MRIDHDRVDNRRAVLSTCNDRSRSEPDPAGVHGGVQVGYYWQTGQWVFGGEVDFSGLNAKADASVSPFFTNKANVTTWSSRYDWLFTARVRGGFTVAPNWLLYATGGLAVTHVNDFL